MTFAVTHTTAYTYAAEVSASYGEAHLLPRDMPGQRVLSASLDITPEPEDVHERLDWFGNRTTYFSMGAGHTALEITARSQVEVAGRGLGDQLLAAQPWEHVVDTLSRAGHGDDGAVAPDLLEAYEFTLDSPRAVRNRALAAYAMPSFRPGRPILEAIDDLSHRVHTDFRFVPGATTVTTPVSEVLAKRVGVCQDFAHLTVAALRSMGLAARYVSGYLETDPPPGKPKLVGADVSHAWASVFVPQTGWVDIDPTNDQFVGDRYITTGWGRDYGDVSPLKGVIFTVGATRSLRVSVDVRRVTAAASQGGGREGARHEQRARPGPPVQQAQGQTSADQRQIQGQQQQQRGPSVSPMDL